MCMINCLLLVSGLVCSANASPLTDKEKMQGIWIVEKQDQGKVYNQAADILPRFLRFEFKGDECTATMRNSKDAPDEAHKVTVVLDSKQKPPYYDTAVNGKTTQVKGIYKFESDESLNIAYGNKDNYRPKGFDPNKEFITVLFLKKKREEKKEKE
jgi:uncharacterized protein (TIGR03067 family)